MSELKIGDTYPSNIYIGNTGLTQAWIGNVIVWPRTPTPTPTITPSTSLVSTPSNTPTRTTTPSITPSLSLSNTQTPTITPTRTPTITPSLSVSATQTPTITPSRSISMSITPTITPSLSISMSLTPSRTPSLTPTLTRTPTPTPSLPAEDFGYDGSFGSASLACADTSPIGTIYTAPNNYPPAVNDIMYTNSSLSTPFAGDSSYYVLFGDASDKWSVRINGSGVIIEVVGCSMLVTPTPTQTPSRTATPTVTPSITPSLSISRTPSITPSRTQPSRTPTPSRTPSITPSITYPSRTPSITPSRSYPSPSITPSRTPSRTPSVTPSRVSSVAWNAASTAQSTRLLSCAEPVGVSVYVASGSNPLTITALYSNSSLTTVYVPSGAPNYLEYFDGSSYYNAYCSAGGNLSSNQGC